MQRDVYSGRLKLNGEGNKKTVIAAYNYSLSLNQLNRFEEAKLLLRKIMPVARRVLGVNAEVTLRMRWSYSESLYKDPAATLDNLREAVTMLEDIERTARRTLGGAHPFTVDIEAEIRDARAVLGTREPK